VVNRERMEEREFGVTVTDGQREFEVKVKDS
jgi:hypothetical protein